MVVKEAERVKAMGFQGILLSGRASKEDKSLDDKHFFPVLEACEALALPIYIHPAAPVNTGQQPYYGGLGDEISARLSLHGWGWHNEAGIQILRTILAGRSDQFPKLQLIAGLQRTVTDTFKQNVYVTPSGIFDYPQLKFCVEVLGAERIIHSADCPFISNEGAKPFIENAPITDEEKEMIAFCNAEQLFDFNL